MKYSHATPGDVLYRKLEKDREEGLVFLGRDAAACRSRDACYKASEACQTRCLGHLVTDRGSRCPYSGDETIYVVVKGEVLLPMSDLPRLAY